jgi:hypothetical protein
VYGGNWTACCSPTTRLAWPCSQGRIAEFSKGTREGRQAATFKESFRVLMCHIAKVILAKHSGKVQKDHLLMEDALTEGLGVGDL